MSITFLTDEAQVLRYDEQELTEEQKTQARENIGAATFTCAFRNSLKAILNGAVYTSNMTEHLAVLNHILDNPYAKIYSVVNNLEMVVTDNADTIATENAPYLANLTVPHEYIWGNVTVTMGGVDITKAVYNGNGKVSIPSVTGDVVITADAIYVGVEDTVVLNISTGFIAGKGLVVYTNKGARAGVAPVGQYLTKGVTYKLSLGEARSDFYFGLQLLQASEPGLTFVDQPVTKETYFDTVTGIIKDVGWRQDDYEFTVSGDNVIMCSNFKTVSGTNFTDADIATLNEQFTIEVV